MKAALRALPIVFIGLLLLGAPAMASVVKIFDLNLSTGVVTVMNTGNDTVDMTGWTITDAGMEHTFTFPSGFRLVPWVPLLIGSGPNQPRGCDILLWTTASVWDDEGDAATLWDANGKKVSSSGGFDAPDGIVQGRITTMATVPPISVPTGYHYFTVTTTYPIPPWSTPVSPITTVPTIQPFGTFVHGPTLPTLPTLIMPDAPLPTGPRFGTRQYVVGTVPSNLSTGVLRIGYYRAALPLTRGTTIGTGVGTGVTPPSGRFVRWSPIDRWLAPHVL